MKETLVQLHLSEIQQKEKVQPQHIVQEKVVPVQETLQIIASGSDIFPITQDMMQLEEETTHKKLMEIDHFHLDFPNIPTKALYKLQVSVTQEVQSREGTDAMELQMIRI
jgi:hypothetical protein